MSAPGTVATWPVSVRPAGLICNIVAVRRDLSKFWMSTPSASLTLAHEDGTTSTHTGDGDGPVDAIVEALELVTGTKIEVLSLAMRSISLGEDAQGEANMRAKVDGVEYSGHGLSTDIVAACAEALLEIVNRAVRNAEQNRESNVA